MMKSGKSMRFFECQKHWFLLLGAHSQNQLYLIFHTFLFIKKLQPSILLNIYFLRTFFHFFALFSLRFNSTKSVVCANKRAPKHCAPSIHSKKTVGAPTGKCWGSKWENATFLFQTNFWSNLDKFLGQIILNFSRYFSIFSEFCVVNMFLAVLIYNLCIIGFVRR